MKIGKFYVLCGSPNLGKTTQSSLVVSALIKKGVQVQYIKYPIYSMEPTGPIVYKLLREGYLDKMTEIEFQKICAQNRRDFEKILVSILDSGINVFAEDYYETAMAWAMTRDVSFEIIKELNKDLREPDKVILMDGTRFPDGHEKGHVNENDDKLVEKNRKMYLKLAKKFKWDIINANQQIEDVHRDIMNIMKDY